jgi:hypothetical protein
MEGQLVSPFGAATLPGSRNGADGNGPVVVEGPAGRAASLRQRLALTSARAPTRGGADQPAAPCGQTRGR